MKETFENTLELGNGIYTVSDISLLLRIPKAKIRTWISKYWDGELGMAYKGNYSWKVDNYRAVGFHTVVEFFVLVQFAEAGVNIRQVLIAHKELAKAFDTNFPFAQKKVLENIKSDGRKIYLKNGENIITLDGTKQLNLLFIDLFFKNLDFGTDLLASRFWPLGKKHAIVCDPHHKFGQPVIDGTNIQAEAIYRMHLSGEPTKFIASLYEVPLKKVLDAIELYKNAA